MMAEGGGIEPLALLRCHPGIRSRLPDRSSGTFRCAVAEGVGIEPTGRAMRSYGLANRCIATLPTFRGITRKIDLIWRGRSGSNRRQAASKAVALPIELRPCSSVVAGSRSWRDYTELYNFVVPQERFELSKGLLLRQVGVPISISHRGRVWWEVMESNHLARGCFCFTGRPLTVRATSRGGPCRIRTCNIPLLRRTRLPIAPMARNYSPSRYRNRKEMVWEVGFEPTASTFRAWPSTGLTLLPEAVGRGRGVFMRVVYQKVATTSNRTAT